MRMSICTSSHSNGTSSARKKMKASISVNSNPGAWTVNKIFCYGLLFLTLNFRVLPVSSTTLCDFPADLTSTRLHPDTYGDDGPLNMATCTTDMTSGALVCLSGTALLDGYEGPPTPNLASNSDRSHFVAWSYLHTPIETLYLSIRQRSRQAVTAIDLYLLNYPAEEISVPNFLTLRGTFDHAFVPATGRVGTALDYDLVNNGMLTVNDNRVRRITLLLRNPSTRQRFVITWNFLGLHNVRWFLLSEVRLCTDNQPTFQPSQIIFSNPVSSAIREIQPSPANLADSNFILLSCTVMNEGLFNWIWRKGTLDLSRNNKNTIASADGTRTSFLVINSLSFRDSGDYMCSVSFKDDSTFTASRQYSILFPLTLQASPSLSSMEGTTSVTMECEVHGYAIFLNPPIWTDNDGTEITTGGRYNIFPTAGSNTLIHIDGSTTPSIMSRLTILSPITQDTGTYRCIVRTVNARNLVSRVVLTVTELPPPPPPPPPTRATTPTTPTRATTRATTSRSTMPAPTTTTAATIADASTLQVALQDQAVFVIPAVISPLFVIIVIIVTADICLLIFCIKKKRQMKLFNARRLSKPYESKNISERIGSEYSHDSHAPLYERDEESYYSYSSQGEMAGAGSARYYSYSSPGEMAGADSAQEYSQEMVATSDNQELDGDEMVITQDQDVGMAPTLDQELDKEMWINQELDKEMGVNQKLDKEMKIDQELDKEMWVDQEQDKEMGINQELDKEMKIDQELDKEMWINQDQDKEMGVNQELDEEIGIDQELTVGDEDLRMTTPDTLPEDSEGIDREDSFKTAVKMGGILEGLVEKDDEENSVQDNVQENVEDSAQESAQEEVASEEEEKEEAQEKEQENVEVDESFATFNYGDEPNL